MAYRINDRFTIQRDSYGWELVEHWMSKPRDGRGPKPYSRSTWHAKLPQACEAVLDRTAGSCETAAELRTIMSETVADMRHIFQERDQ